MNIALKKILICFFIMLVMLNLYSCIPEEKNTEVEIVVSELKKAGFTVNRSSIEFGPLVGGTAVLIADNGAFWVKYGKVYASNGVAKTWAPHLSYANAETAGFLQVQNAVKSNNQ